MAATRSSLAALREAIVTGDVTSTIALTEDALKEGVSSERLHTQAMMPAMEQPVLTSPRARHSCLSRSQADTP